jgi:hypothetical protein
MIVAQTVPEHEKQHAIITFWIARAHLTGSQQFLDFIACQVLSFAVFEPPEYG